MNITTISLSVHMKKKILNEVNLEIPSGKFVTIVGPNGSGKTTLLKAISGLIPFKGDILLNGKSVKGIFKNKDDKKIAYIPQNMTIPDGMTLAEYVMFGRISHLGWFKVESHKDFEIVMDALKKVNLLNYSKNFLKTLSGGEMQRAIIARTLAQEADILILDEPTAFMDFARSSEIVNILNDFRLEKKITILMSSHDINNLIPISDIIVALKQGEKAYSGDVKGFLDEKFLSLLYDTKIKFFYDNKKNIKVFADIT